MPRCGLQVRLSLARPGLAVITNIHAPTYVRQQERGRRAMLRAKALRDIVAHRCAARRVGGVLQQPGEVIAIFQVATAGERDQAAKG